VDIDQEHWPELSQLLDEALELPPDAREHWLDALPARHAELKETLRQLLKHHAAAQTKAFLDTMLKVDEAANSDPGAPPLEPRLKSGTVVGQYIIEEEIGRGGMGAVWRARREDGVLKRAVALKLPHAGFHGDDLIVRFARERDILSSLAHAHIARLYDAGFDTSGQPYLALEYVDGKRITRYCDDLGLDIRARLKLFQQVLGAIQYAHAHLVIHRDIKPSNVLVTADGHAMLLDFGIAKLIEANSLDDAHRTHFAAALTPDYASPEQIAQLPVTTASDIYSLGVLLYQLLTGKRPYQLARDTRRDLENAILNADPPRPQLHDDLDTIILKALKKEPGERYATADAFNQDIERYLRGEPVMARPDSNWYRARKFVARHRVSVAAAGVAMVLVAVAAGVAFFEAHQAAEQRDHALALSSRNEAVTEFLNMLITEAAGSDKPVAVSDMLERSEALVGSEYRDSPEHRAAVLDMLGIYYHTNGQDTRAEPLLRKALEAVRNSSDDDLRRKLTCDHAMTVAALGKVEEGTRALNAVIGDPKTSAQQSADCLEYLAWIAQDAGDAAGALTYGKLALDKLRAVGRPLLSVEAMYLASMGYAEHLNGRNDAADRYYTESLAAFERAGRGRSPSAITARNNWALVSNGAGNPRRELELYEESLQIFAQNYPDQAAPPFLLGNRAHALELLGRYDDARKGYQECLASNERAGTVYSRAFCVLGLESVAQQTGDITAARKYLADVSASIAPLVPPSSPPALGLRTARARLDVATGNFAQARTDLDFVLANVKSGNASGPALLTRAELNLAEEKVAAAESDARAALNVMRQAQGGIQYSNRTGVAWLTLGQVLQKRGDTGAARDAFHNAVTHLANTVDPTYPKLVEARRLAGE
jgi:serine/threonine-protein kinase